MNYYFEGLKNYAVFSGRARRKEYWLFVLFSALVQIALTQFVSEDAGSFYSLAVLVPTIAIGVRRMHDVNKNGWFLLIPIYSLILACTDGTKGQNRYGEDPKMRPAEGVAVIPPAGPTV
jgi:uncharacterized membrane protein YhaH (DUF805 family)